MAQLVARSVWGREVKGSSPFALTVMLAKGEGSGELTLHPETWRRGRNFAFAKRRVVTSQHNFTFNTARRRKGHGELASAGSPFVSLALMPCYNVSLRPKRRSAPGAGQCEAGLLRRAAGATAGQIR